MRPLLSPSPGRPGLAPLSAGVGGGGGGHSEILGMLSWGFYGGAVDTVSEM